MTELAVVRRYAQALFQASTSANEVDTVEADLLLVQDLLKQNPQLDRVLRAPTIAAERKESLVRATLTGKVSELTLRFLGLVISRRRESVLAAAYREFHVLANTARGVLPVDVLSAVALTADEQVALATSLGKRTGKKVIIHAEVDATLLGGVIVRLGDTVIDGSIRTRLAQLRQHLAAGQAG